MLKGGVTIVSFETQQNINFISDLIVKALCGACTILLGVAVNSLDKMNDEIKHLSTSVNTLTVSSTVVLEAQKQIVSRLEKVENENSKIQGILVRLEVIEKTKNIK